MILPSNSPCLRECDFIRTKKALIDIFPTRSPAVHLWHTDASLTNSAQ